MSDFEARVTAGLQLEREERDAEAIEHFRQLLADYPDEARAHFEYAGAFDSAGQEAEAVPHYRRAMALGLDDDHLARATLQLGSSLRNIGDYAGAVMLLTEGCQRFPDRASLRVFLAFAQESAGESQAAITNLLNLAIDHIHTPDMQRYQRALRYYTDERTR